MGFNLVKVVALNIDGRRGRIVDPADFCPAGKSANKWQSMNEFLTFDPDDMLFLALCALFAWYLYRISQMDEPPGPE